MKIPVLFQDRLAKLRKLGFFDAPEVKQTVVKAVTSSLQPPPAKPETLTPAAKVAVI